MDSNQKAVYDRLKPLSPQEARDAINAGKIFVGEPGSPNHNFAFSLIASKESAMREAHEGGDAFNCQTITENQRLQRQKMV